MTTEQTAPKAFQGRQGEYKEMQNPNKVICYDDGRKIVVIDGSIKKLEENQEPVLGHCLGSNGNGISVS
jgi:hypothetical protein